MGFAGLKKPEDRADVIDWLRLQSDNRPSRCRPGASKPASDRLQRDRRIR
jgi:hypothetical protein